jgi:hypothetical protein
MDFKLNTSLPKFQCLRLTLGDPEMHTNVRKKVLEEIRDAPKLKPLFNL